MWAKIWKQPGDKRGKENRKCWDFLWMWGVCLFPACSPVALFPSERVGRRQKEKEVGFVKKKSFYIVASHTDWCCGERSMDNLFFVFFFWCSDFLFVNKDLRYQQSFKKNPIWFEFLKDWFGWITFFPFTSSLLPPVGLWQTGGHWLLSPSELSGPCNRPSSPGERTHLPPPSLSRSFERRRFQDSAGHLLRFQPCCVAFFSEPTTWDTLTPWRVSSSEVRGSWEIQEKQTQGGCFTSVFTLFTILHVNLKVRYIEMLTRRLLINFLPKHTK